MHLAGESAECLRRDNLHVPQLRRLHKRLLQPPEPQRHLTADSSAAQCGGITARRAFIGTELDDAFRVRASLQFLQSELTMAIDVDIDDLAAANLFLRALWARLRAEFEGCHWQYVPFRDGPRKLVTFGWIAVGPEGNPPVFDVSISYKQRGSIRQIHFEPHNRKAAELTDVFAPRFHKVVASALADFRDPPSARIQFAAHGLSSTLHAYRGDRIHIEPGEGAHVIITASIQAFDAVDLDQEGTAVVPRLLDILSLETGKPFWTVALSEGLKLKEVPEPNEIFTDDYPLAGEDVYPPVDGRYAISRSCLWLLDYACLMNAPVEVTGLFRAANHYHTARKYDAQVNDLVVHVATEEVGEGKYHMRMGRREDLAIASDLGAMQSEMSVALYMSALEVATLTEAEPASCEHCGQPVYRISARVRELIEQHFGQGAVRRFRDPYAHRSKYLHRGIPSTRGFTGSAVPQLDPDDPTGCLVYHSVDVRLLRGVTSFCLRSEVRRVAEAVL